MATTGINVLGITLAIWTAAVFAHDISLRETCPTNTSVEFASKFYQRRILSPNYPYRYFLTDSNCSWLIQCNLFNGSGYIIEVVINAFSLEGSENSLSFYDGDSPTTSRLLGTYRRSYSPDHGVFYTTGPFLYIELKVLQKPRWGTDGYWRWREYDRGRFNISYLAVKKETICSPPFSDSKVQWLHGSSGTLFGPNYPNPYANAIGTRSCTWVISVSTGNMVNLTFEHSLYEAFGTHGSVEVRDGKSAHDEMIFNAGFGNQFSVYSTGRYMRIKFSFFISGRDGNQGRGLRAHFKATPLYMRETCLPGNKLNRQLLLTGDQGTLKSPMKYYPPNLYCRWSIKVPGEKPVELTFKRIDTARSCTDWDHAKHICLSYECEDYVEVQWVERNYTMVRKKYCGFLYKAKDKYHKLPDAIISTNGSLTVIFSSNAKATGIKHSGFEATFKVVDPSNGKTRKMAIGVSVGVVMLIALVTSIVCFVRRRKARALSNQLTTPLTRANAGDTGHVTAMETRNNSRDTSLAATRAITTASYGTKTSPLSPQATGQHSVNLSPSMNSVSLQKIPSGPPPAYPGSPDSPPPYPGIVEVPQYPPPGQSYPWEQRPQPSAPPPRP